MKKNKRFLKKSIIFVSHNDINIISNYLVVKSRKHRYEEISVTEESKLTETSCIIIIIIIHSITNIKRP